jgi:phenylpyruvate tautomerase PptA (4-oxalocrotonate tautomerase family)
MPYVEILAPPASKEAKLATTRCVTEGIVASFSVMPSTVTIYFLPLGAEDCAHAGILSPGIDGQRIFIKIHAYRRGLAERRALAAAVTSGIAAAYGAAPRNIAVYFLDRGRDEVAHAGGLACDEEVPEPTPASAREPLACG